jgi:hypothetical protein
MRQFQNVSLESDPLAARYVKDELVTVRFAAVEGVIQSREGPNHYQRADALVTGSTGDNWSVIRARFEEKYEPLAPREMGQDGSYRARRIPVWARQIDEPFAVERRAGGDRLTGNAGDWLLQYAPGDFGLVEDKRFKGVYRLWQE